MARSGCPRKMRHACSFALFATFGRLPAAAAPGKATKNLCAAAVVLPFNATRPFDAAGRASLARNPTCTARFGEIRTVRGRQRERLTVGYSYYCDVHHLEHNVRLWNTFPAVILDHVHFLIVDDGSPDEARAAPVVARNVEAASGSPASRSDWRFGRAPSPTQASRSSRSNRTSRGTLGALGICSSRWHRPM